MTPTDRWRTRVAASTLPGLLVAGMLAAAAPAQAQLIPPRDGTIDTQLWQPAIGPRNFLTVENTSIPEHKLLGFQLALTYQRHPYTIYTQGFTTGIDQRRRLPVVVASCRRRWACSAATRRALAIPFTLYLAGDKVDDTGTPTYRRLTESGIGNVRIEGKALLATLGEDEEYTVAVSAGLSLPTGEADEPSLPERQELHRPHQGDRRRRLRQAARRRQPGHPAARDLVQLQDRARAPAAVRRRRGLSGRTPRRPDPGGLRAQRPDPVHRASTPTSTRSRPSIAGRYTVNGMWSVTGRRRARLRQRHRRARPAAVRHGRVRPRLPRPRQGRRLRRQRQVPG